MNQSTKQRLQKVECPLFFFRKVFLGIALLLAGASTLPTSAQAGTIDFGTILEFKGTITATTTDIFLNHNELTIFSTPPPTIYHRVIESIEIVTTEIEFDVYNLYPVTIEVPQPLIPDQPIDFYWVMTGDYGDGIGSMAAGSTLDSTSMNTVPTGFVSMSVTPISDLTDLPTSSANDDLITWDLSGLSSTNGNFYLVSGTVAFEALPVPEPTSLVLMGLGGLALLRRRRA